MSKPFNQRAYGCAIIKSINSNYNADFTGQPRQLPSGVVYATDKALKYSVRNYWNQVLNEKVFYFKSFDENLSPNSLDETFVSHFGAMKSEKDKDKNKLRLEILGALLSCLDVRLFGGTYAGKTNISVHGTCQITHGVNRFTENTIYTEQILSPFRNSNEANAESTMSSIGSQSKLEEGHYVHHFSVNPQNIADNVLKTDNLPLNQNDIDKLKEALRRGATYYDSAAKSGTDNELLLWIELKEGSKQVLPSLVNLVDVDADKVINLSKVSSLLAEAHIASEIDSIELYYNQSITKIADAPKDAKHLPL